MQTLPAKQIKPEDLIEINIGQFEKENWQWALVLDIKEKDFNVRSFFVKVGRDKMFWTEDFEETHEFNVLIKDPTIEVSI